MQTTFKTGTDHLQRNEERLQELHAWLVKQVAKPLQRLQCLAGDASFRRYFRVHCDDTSYIAMDAPPDKESCQPFVAIAKTFHKLGLNVPVIYAEDLTQGFLLLSDFGDQHYLQVLFPETCDRLYRAALNDLLLIQSCQSIEGYKLPKFTAQLYHQEMALFRDWYLRKYLGLSLSQAEQNRFQYICDLLSDDALSQPQVCVHRDYHSRNLMVVKGTSQPGILDFQDALWGPITYDLLSLLRDCYIDWPPDQVSAWALQYQQQLLKAGLLEEKDPELFLRWFDWIGLQRNLKCIGIFARLKVRDNKSDYLQYIPRVLNYAQLVCDRYPEFSDLKPLLNKKRLA